MIVRRILLIAGILFGLVVVFFGAEFLFPQIVEAELKLTCPMTAPSANCQARMVSMGHVWALRGNLARAAVWYSRAAEAGNPAAMFHLAWAHEQRGYHGFKATLRAPADPDGATAFKEGPDRSVEALRGAGFQLAAKWYRKSADQGFAPAMNNLGELYLAGVLGRRDVEEAFRWHLAAARAGNPIAAANVSLDYRMGRGVAVDEGQAREWATFPTAQGYAGPRLSHAEADGDDGLAGRRSYAPSSLSRRRKRVCRSRSTSSRCGQTRPFPPSARSSSNCGDRRPRRRLRRS